MARNPARAPRRPDRRLIAAVVLAAVAVVLLLRVFGLMSPDSAPLVEPAVREGAGID